MIFSSVSPGLLPLVCPPNSESAHWFLSCPQHWSCLEIFQENFAAPCLFYHSSANNIQVKVVVRGLTKLNVKRSCSCWCDCCRFRAYAPHFPSSPNYVALSPPKGLVLGMPIDISWSYPGHGCMLQEVGYPEWSTLVCSYVVCQRVKFSCLLDTSSQSGRRFHLASDSSILPSRQEHHNRCFYGLQGFLWCPPSNVPWCDWASVLSCQ